MLVSDVMTKEPITIDSQCSLLDAARVMRDEDCGVLPVLKDDQLVGILTDRDIVIYAGAEGRALEQTRVTEIMTEDVATCHANKTLEAAADRMSVRSVRRLVVVDEQDKIIGIVSLHDLMLNIGDEKTTDEVVHHLLRFA